MWEGIEAIASVDQDSWEKFTVNGWDIGDETSSEAWGLFNQLVLACTDTVPGDPMGGNFEYGEEESTPISARTSRTLKCPPRKKISGYTPQVG